MGFLLPSMCQIPVLLLLLALIILGSTTARELQQPQPASKAYLKSTPGHKAAEFHKPQGGRKDIHININEVALTADYQTPCQNVSHDPSPRHKCKRAMVSSSRTPSSPNSGASPPSSSPNPPQPAAPPPT